MSMERTTADTTEKKAPMVSLSNHNSIKKKHNMVVFTIKLNWNVVHSHTESIMRAPSLNMVHLCTKSFMHSPSLKIGYTPVPGALCIHQHHHLI